MPTPPNGIADGTAGGGFGHMLRASVALETLAKSSPFKLKGENLVGDGLALPLCTQADATLANVMFRRGVARAIEAISESMKETPHVSA